MVAIDGEPAGDLHAEKSVLIGPCRVIGQEIPGFAIKGLDVPFLERGEVPDWLVDGVVAEALTDERAPLVALRPDGRRVEEYRELPELAVGNIRAPRLLLNSSRMLAK